MDGDRQRSRHELPCHLVTLIAAAVCKPLHFLFASLKCDLPKYEIHDRLLIDGADKGNELSVVVVVVVG